MNTAQDIKNINTLLAPYGLQVNEVVKGAQNIKYKIDLPLDLGIQGKIRRAETNIKYALPGALGTNEFSFGHDKGSIYIERRSDDFQIVKFNDFIGTLHRPGLNLVLGVDEDGKKVVTNLSKAPHILVGGTTGSGKSELLHCFVASLIEGVNYTDVELCIIDPKRSEFTPYRGCPKIKLCTEMSEACSCLKTGVEIMENRYRILEKSRAKDIYHYSGSEKMYPIVFIIDELADLMRQCPESEQYIIRIAQKARACGIHLIMGTQSPRRDVVTGLIKSNVPTKIALHTSNQVESRIILDQSGAENLLGKGDILFMANGSFKPIRIQSAFVDESTKSSLASRLKRIPSDPIEVCEEPREVRVSYDHFLNHEEPIQKPKRVGLIRGLINLINVKPIMFKSDEYPPRI